MKIKKKMNLVLVTALQKFQQEEINIQCTATVKNSIGKCIFFSHRKTILAKKKVNNELADFYLIERLQLIIKKKKKRKERVQDKPNCR